MSQTPSHILENLQTALPAVVKALKGGWDNIQNFAIKTNSSASLPIWSCTLDETQGGRWNGLQAQDGEEEDNDDESGESDSEEEVKVRKVKQASGKGRKRVSNSDKEEEDDKPRKKSKAADGTSITKMKVASPLKASKLTSADVISSEAPKSTEIATSLPKVVSTSKKGKQAKVSVTAEDVVSPGPEPRSKKTLAVPEPTEDTKGKKKKSQRKSVSFASPSSSSAAADVPLKKTKSIKPEPSILTNDDLSPSSVSSSVQDQTKKNKRAKGADTLSPAFGSSTKASISKEEIKQKRSAIAGEKKKKIIIRSKGGKSVKNAVLGRKVAQE